ncbi:short transient receptor potential channel 4 isoform X1 [Hydra vulgaris]|uniref:Short transient receptor potential channel 4 isoform X1 n=2 Tax=Hydra vulgaris TaxID=6087 RepID=A0ABM4DJ03_HYDVU
MSSVWENQLLEMKIKESVSNISRKLTVFPSWGLEYDNLLAEAVQRNAKEAVKLLLRFTSNLSSNNFAPNKSLTAAAQTGNLQLIELFTECGYTIADGHDVDCECEICTNDCISQSKERIKRLRAQINPVWIFKTSTNPLVTGLNLWKTTKQLAVTDDSFEKDYTELATIMKHFCLDLLDEVNNKSEVNCIMNCGKTKDLSKLSFINMAIEMDHKEIVAHPVPQHLLSSMVYDGIWMWKKSGFVYKMLVVLSIAISFSITSIAYIIYPKSKLGKLLENPFVKFINTTASFIVFLGLLAALSMSQKSGIRLGARPDTHQILILLWTLGFSLQEINHMIYLGKRRYFESVWNWIDMSMMSLIIAAYVVWGSVHLTPFSKNIYISIGDSFFAISIVLSFFHVVYLCQVIRFLGLLQLCLGRMIKVIFQFAFISCVVLWSFSVSMVFLFHSVNRPLMNNTVPIKPGSNSTNLANIVKGGYDGLAAAMVTLAWASINLVGLDSLRGFDDGTMILLSSYLLFTFYHCVSMIVLLNMLIAMMSKSYQQIEDNIEVEHKFARTNLWLEYIGKNNSLPAPFNLIPTIAAIKTVTCWIQLMILEVKRNKGLQRTKQDKTLMKEFNELCKNLLARYLRKKNLLEQPDVVDVEKEKDFLLYVLNKIELWSKLEI